MLEIALAILGYGVQALLAWLGIAVSLRPPDAPRRQRYVWGFLVVALMGFAVQTGQLMNSRQERAAQQRERQSLQNEIVKLQTGITTVQEQTKQPPQVNVNVPAPVVRVIPSARERTPLPSYPLGGDRSVLYEAQPGWFPVRNHVDVVLDWSTLKGIDATAEITFVFRSKKRPPEGTGSIQARVQNMTDNIIAAEETLTATEAESTKRLKLKRSTGVKTYRLEMWPQGSGLMNVFGAVVLSWQYATRRRWSTAARGR